MLISLLALKRINSLKVLSYWNLNLHCSSAILSFSGLKVLSYWNLNENELEEFERDFKNLKYYHIGI